MSTKISWATINWKDNPFLQFMTKNILGMSFREWLNAGRWATTCVITSVYLFKHACIHLLMDGWHSKRVSLFPNTIVTTWRRKSLWYMKACAKRLDYNIMYWSREWRGFWSCLISNILDTIIGNNITIPCQKKSNIFFEKSWFYFLKFDFWKLIAP